MGPPMKTRKNKVPSGGEKMGNDKAQSKERQGRVDLVNGHTMLICMEAGRENDHRDGWRTLIIFLHSVRLFSCFEEICTPPPLKLRPGLNEEQAWVTRI